MHNSIPHATRDLLESTNTQTLFTNKTQDESIRCFCMQHLGPY